MNETNGFETFVAQSEMELGDTSFKITTGDEIQFDGNRRAIIGGEEFDFPNLAGCIEKGWLVPKGQEGQAPPRPSANIKMRKPTPQGNDSIPSQDVRSGRREFVVGSVHQRQEQGQQMSRQKQSSRQNVQQGFNRNVNQSRGQMPVHGSQGQPVGGNFQNSARNPVQKVTRGTTGASARTGGSIRPTTPRNVNTPGEQEAQRQREMRRRQMMQNNGQQGPQNGPQQRPQQGQYQGPQNGPHQGYGQGPQNGRPQQGQYQGYGQGPQQGPNESVTRAEGMSFQNQGISNTAAQKGGANGVSKPARQPGYQNQSRQPQAQAPQQGHHVPQQQTSQGHGAAPASQARQNVDAAQEDAGLNDVNFNEQGVVDESTASDVAKPDESENRVEPEVEVTVPDEYDLKDKEDRLDFVKIIFPDLEWELESKWTEKMKKLDEDPQFEDPLQVRAVYAVESAAMKKEIEECFGDAFPS